MSKCSCERKREKEGERFCGLLCVSVCAYVGLCAHVCVCVLRERTRCFSVRVREGERESVCVVEEDALTHTHTKTERNTKSHITDCYIRPPPTPRG
jgi:hypothetical protein